MHSEITCWNFGQVYLVEACWLTVIISLINKTYGPVSKGEREWIRISLLDENLDNSKPLNIIVRPT